MPVKRLATLVDQNSATKSNQNTISQNFKWRNFATFKRISCKKSRIALERVLFYILRNFHFKAISNQDSFKCCKIAPFKILANCILIRLRCTILIHKGSQSFHGHFTTTPNNIVIAQLCSMSTVCLLTQQDLRFLL
jgi:hypothetical protein